MCGRFVQDDDLNTMMSYFAVTEQRHPHVAPHWNLAPTDTIALVLDHHTTGQPRQRLLGPARWSLVPPWEKSLTLPYSTFNARAEKVATTQSFRQALHHHRALIPTGGYYEWVNHHGVKTPHFVTSPTDHPLAFAGLYSWWSTDDTGPPVCTATILTTHAPDHLAWVHPRTPVFLPGDWWDQWLDPHTVGTQDMVNDLIRAQPAITSTLTAYAVRPVRGNSPDLVTPLNG